MIPVYKPYLPPDSLRHAQHALATGWVSSLGEYTERAEMALAERLGVKHAILVSNGTVAGHLMSRCVKRFFPQVRRFLVPNNVFVAAWNALLYEWPVSALVPVDADLRTWNADYSSIDPSQYGPETCILAVHNLGNVINVPALRKRFPRCLICEDACETAFGSYEGQPAGSSSFMATYSFFSNKNISCGEGGAVLTNDDEAARFVRLLKGQGQGPTRYLHTELGYNYRMTNVQAALLLGQLELWDDIRAMKRALFRAYSDRLAGSAHVRLQAEEPGTVHSNWMFGIRVPGLPGYEAAAEEFSAAGIETRSMFFPIDRHSHLREVGGHNANAETLHRECLSLPSWPGLSDSQIDHVCSVVERLSLRTLQPV